MSDERQREVGAGEVDDAERLSESSTVAPSAPVGGQAGSASGGYGTGSASGTSGGTGSGDDETSAAGDDPQTDWLRDAPGAGGER